MGRKLAVGTVVFGGITLLGLPLGLLWWLIAPRPEATVTSRGLAYYPLSQTWFAVDGHYSLMMLVAGLAVGYVCYLVQQRVSHRHRLDLRLPTLLGVAAGTAAGSLVAWGVGVGLDLRAADDALLLAGPGDVVRTGLALRAHSALLLWPFSAVLQYGLFEALTLWQAEPDDGAEESARTGAAAGSGGRPGRD
ncbi:hypothetical protein FOF52_02555 [Thermobifida alba]|uniref:DUF2567 domain-containing protein n=1 Tax=Thermobifida alba TaxID=53522 RepID=A0ABY4L0H1_THEAE|nr:hypothetical protein [Thermobifida alba]UPT19988.1 hypothetical protein FOF52_02555 [Thermobifida alba]